MGYGLLIRNIPMLLKKPRASINPKLILISSEGNLIEKEVDRDKYLEEIQPDQALIGFGEPTYWINDHLLYLTIYAQSPYTFTSQLISHIGKVIDPFQGIWQDDLNKDSLYAIWLLFPLTC